MQEQRLNTVVSGPPEGTHGHFNVRREQLLHRNISLVGNNKTPTRERKTAT